MGQELSYLRVRLAGIEESLEDALEGVRETRKKLAMEREEDNAPVTAVPIPTSRGEGIYVGATWNPDNVMVGWMSDNRCGSENASALHGWGVVGAHPHAAHPYGRDNAYWCDGYV